MSIAGTAPPPEAQQIRKAARGIEGMFLAQLIKVMRATVPGGKKGLLTGQGPLGEFADMELGRVLAERQSIGLADMLERSLARREASGRVARDEVPVDLRPRTIPLKPRLPDRIAGHVRAAAERYRLDPQLIQAVIAVESGGDPTALSSRNAKGLMQITDSTAQTLGVQNVWSPGQNIDAGARYLRQLLDRFDDKLELALAAYNAGPATVKRYGGIPPYPETRAYVRNVLSRYRQDHGGKAVQRRTAPGH